MNILESQNLVQDLRQENEQLTRNRTQVIVTGITVIIGLLMIGLRFDINLLYVLCANFVVLCVMLVFNHNIKNNIKMNNFMIVLVHSCIQSEFNPGYNPGSDEVIQNRNLVK